MPVLLSSVYYFKKAFFALNTGAKSHFPIFLGAYNLTDTKEYDNIDSVPHKKRGRVKMKKLPSVKAVMAITTILLVNICSFRTLDGTKKTDDSIPTIPSKTILVSSISNYRLLSSKNANQILAINETASKQQENIAEEKEVEPEIVYDGMTLEQLAKKLDKNLKSTLKGYGMVFAQASVKYGVDPYLALAIVLHETGCDSGTCSALARNCNNIGGMKGSKTCGNSSYAKFSSLNAGIDAFFKNLSTNYYKKGLKTPESIGKKYAESKTWATNVRYYMKKIKNS